MWLNQLKSKLWEGNNPHFRIEAIFSHYHLPHIVLDLTYQRNGKGRIQWEVQTKIYQRSLSLQMLPEIFQKFTETSWSTTKVQIGIL